MGLKIVAHLLNQKHKCLQRDSYIFDDGARDILKSQSASELANWIVTRRPVIMKSMQLAKARDTRNVSAITTWFQPLKNKVISWINHGNEDALRYDPFSKKKKNRNPRTAPNPSIQTDLCRYLTLRKVY